MTSTRLPGKVMLEAGGATVLAHHVHRLGWSGYPVFVATTTNAADDSVVSASLDSGAAGVSRGSEHDVLSRFAEAARNFDLDVVVRVTSDCPLIDGEIVRQGVEEYLERVDPRAFVSNTLDRTYPRGFDFEVFGAELLYEADRLAHSSAEREHVTPYMYVGGGSGVNLRSIRRTVDASRFRLTLDTPDDWAVISQLIDGHSAHLMTGDQIVELLEDHPEIARMNADVSQKNLEA
jgi:spore coat polysaccharide biosynthesis protein SpsF